MSNYYKRFNKSEHMGFLPSEKAYEGYKAIEGSIVGSDKDGEYVLVRTEAIDEFIITALSRQDFRSEGYNPDTLSDEDMQGFADKMAEHYIDNGSYWDDIDGYGKALELEPYENEDEEDEE